MLIIERFICEHVPFALKMEVKLKGRCVVLTKLNLTSTVNAIPDNFFNVNPEAALKKKKNKNKNPNNLNYQMAKNSLSVPVRNRSATVTFKILMNKCNLINKSKRIVSKETCFCF